MSDRTDYLAKAQGIASDALGESLQDVVRELIDDGKLEHYGRLWERIDELIHELCDSAHGHVGLLEAAQILDVLDDYEETDDGLWQGLEPRKAVAAQAFWTFRNAALYSARELITSINDDEEVGRLLARLADTPDDSYDDSGTTGPMDDRLARLICEAEPDEWGVCCDLAADTQYHAAADMRADLRYRATCQAVELVLTGRVRELLRGDE